MSDQPENASTEQTLDPIRAEAKALLAEIKKIRSQTEEHLKAAEQSRRKADEDASYAFQAKVNTEEHSKATAILKGTAEVDANAIIAHKQKSDELLGVLSRGKADVDADVKVINERRKDLEQAISELLKAAQAGNADFQEIEKLKVDITALVRESQQMRDAAIQSRNDAETAQKQAEASFAKANNHLSQVEQAETTGSEKLNEITNLLTTAQKERADLATVLEHIKNSDAIATDFESRLNKSAEEMEALIKKATGLLPGFASASLAHSFNEQKKRFEIPQKRWLRIFIWCIVGLGVVASPSFFIAVFGNMFGIQLSEQWSDIFRGMVMRLPIVIPLVWLAIYAGRNYMLSIRLEEDYAYKEAISKAFEGYKREMSTIPTADPAAPSAPLNTLCVNVLTAISDRPGRIYEGKHKDITPLNEAHGALHKAVELSQQQIATQ